MIFNFGDCVVDIDTEATRKYYSENERINDCDCTGCRNFRAAIINCSDKVKTAFSSYGIDDMRCITEIIPWFNVNTNDARNGKMWYEGFFHISGKIISENKDAEKEMRGIFIEDYFKVCANSESFLTPPHFPNPLMLSIDTYLPWVIDDVNDWEIVEY